VCYEFSCPDTEPSEEHDGIDPRAAAMYKSLLALCRSTADKWVLANDIECHLNEGCPATNCTACAFGVADR